MKRFILWSCSEKKVMVLIDTWGKILILFFLMLKHLDLYTVSLSALNTCFYYLAEAILKGYWNICKNWFVLQNQYT